LFYGFFPFILISKEKGIGPPLFNIHVPQLFVRAGLFLPLFFVPFLLCQLFFFLFREEARLPSTFPPLGPLLMFSFFFFRGAPFFLLLFAYCFFLPFLSSVFFFKFLIMNEVRTLFPLFGAAFSSLHVCTRFCVFLVVKACIT